MSAATTASPAAPPAAPFSALSLRLMSKRMKGLLALFGVSIAGSMYLRQQQQAIFITTTATATATSSSATPAASLPAAAAPAVAASAAKRKVAPAQHLLGGTVGGILGIVASYPFDTVKVRIQTQAHKHPSGMIDCFKHIVRTEGVASLYRGMLSPVVGVAGVKAVVFGSYGALQSFLLERKQRQMPQHSRESAALNTLETIAASCGAGFVATAVVTPVERVKVAMQSATTAYKSTLDCTLSLLRTDGLANGLYKGFSATVLREVPSYGFYFLSYEVAKKAFLKPNQDPATLSPALLALSGGLAGIMAWVPIYPIDVVKSRIQAQASGSGAKLYTGVVDCAVKSYQQEGLAVFFRGLTPTIARAFPCHAAVFLGYEMTLRMTASLFNKN